MVAPLHTFLTALADGLAAAEKRAYEAVATDPLVQRAAQSIAEDRPDRYYLALRHPLGQRENGVVASVIPESAEAQFLYNHYAFVECHFKAVIEQAEGSACCADKARTVLTRLARYFRTGQPLTFEDPSLRDFQRPGVVLTTPEDILSFFRALWALHYGKAEPFDRWRAARLAR